MADAQCGSISLAVVSLKLAWLVAVTLVFVDSSASFESLCKPGGGWETVFEDNFNGRALNGSSWTIRTKNDWAKYPPTLICYYSEKNIKVEDGFLVIEARREEYSGFNYTCGYLYSYHKFDLKYGRVCFGAMMPPQNWPALWMMPSNEECYLGRGEIDVVEMVQGNGQVHGSLHWNCDKESSTVPPCNFTFLTCTGMTFNPSMTDLHEYAVEWTADRVTYYFDGEPYVSCDQEPAQKTYVPQRSMHFIMNLAMGGWGGEPTAKMKFPQQLRLDYVRATQHPSSHGSYSRGDSRDDTGHILRAWETGMPFRNPM